MDKYEKVEDLLENLEDSIDYLSYKFNIEGYLKEDLKQELYRMVIEIWSGENLKDRGINWWFYRCKWYLLNMITKSKREPLDNSISLDSFLEKNRDKE